ncbi:MAG: hypothetical protein EWV92_05830 [Microcystis aeruginosa Ma_MB_S_20031200_S102]|uniref:Uncharacterized protein n=1 Tax=Microcystis aeruginosa Ma_MB_S_20031200_S102 TaxID=2486254 RepID=A0A552EZY8_MICAE|nr:MAG: hypothetical protein EWV79_06490 [Microcystis aeruginosa Ma_MB_S_20031200_S102D]TRU40035.1 MAG: hypothetical protein EWV92_05830 [Microcystis aeruginosa Ma_MB_S_20031200_S102]
MKTRGFERRFSQNLAPVSREKPQNPYFAYISHLFSKPYLVHKLVQKRGRQSLKQPTFAANPNYLLAKKSGAEFLLLITYSL